MQETKEILTKSQWTLYDVRGNDRVFYITQDKKISELFDLISNLNVPMIQDLSDEDLINFRTFLLNEFPLPLSELVHICIVEKEDSRGAFAMFSQ